MRLPLGLREFVEVKFEDFFIVLTLQSVVYYSTSVDLRMRVQYNARNENLRAKFFVVIFGNSKAVLLIRIRGTRIVSLDPDPYEKMAGSGIRIRIK